MTDRIWDSQVQSLRIFNAMMRHVRHISDVCQAHDRVEPEFTYTLEHAVIAAEGAPDPFHTWMYNTMWGHASTHMKGMYGMEPDELYGERPLFSFAECTNLTLFRVKGAFVRVIQRPVISGSLMLSGKRKRSLDL